MQEVSPSPTALISINKIRGWIDHCRSSHAHCATIQAAEDAGKATFPARLIELNHNGTSNARLSSPSHRVPYVALTHCWGTSVQSTTTTENLRLRQQQLDVSDLVQTIQDAVSMTLALKFDYLWIDSICIVQDDRREWAIESMKMADIYSEAELVIAATSTTDCANGFLHTRHTPISLNLELSSSKALTVYARHTEIHQFGNVSFNMDRYPLFQRAWCKIVSLSYQQWPHANDGRLSQAYKKEN